ncbi:deoxyribodipyrimidine photo-lyase [Microbacterium sp. 1P10UB]|uniref:deoxyribodipyrimidine photo-lyase n=1 Tax=unclassified Microbacterium TaxID=2609290 RepID=UPI0039A37126
MANDDTPGDAGRDVYAGIQSERVRQLNDIDEPGDGAYVLYWMQQSQRAEFNHALEYAVHRANELEQPLLVCFGITEDYPDAQERHYSFMLEGLADVAQALKKRDITFVAQRGTPDDVAAKLSKDASLVVTDRGYLRIQRQWRDRVAKDANVPVVQVESDVVVPVELASDKKESAARTLRPKITKHLERFLVPLRATTVKNTSLDKQITGEDLSDVPKLLQKLSIARDVPAVAIFTGGTTAAKKMLRAFIEDSLPHYAENRNQPQTNDVSHMSKYLHFGQISPVHLALEVKKAGGGENVDGFLEELIIRRELPQNYVFYEPHYDSYQGLPEWARETLQKHAKDEREHVYTRAQLEKGETHDEYWNAAMREMVVSGYMHNHMRMYWGKKIIEWSKTPETAYRTALYLNNKYFLDGRDPNSFSNIAWLFGQHDRGWTERDVFGTVRYMNAAGLERKADPKAYVEKVEKIAEQVESEG